MILIIITFAFSIFLVLPLQKTRKILNKLSKGEVLGIAKLRDKSNDEIGEMAQSFNSLLDKIQEIIPDIDMVLLLAIEPGAQGRSFDYKVFERIKANEHKRNMPAVVKIS